ncbi:hypothetical protein G7054_g6264 [Neopestalotiopsis clavispora]|nr:hypothetical protein G7054_g6264 [Neopestalotiopsis clavispora]
MTAQPTFEGLIQIKVPAGAIDETISSRNPISGPDSASEGDSIASIVGIGSKGPDDLGHSYKYLTNTQNLFSLYRKDFRLIKDWIDQPKDHSLTAEAPSKQAIDQQSANAEAPSKQAIDQQSANARQDKDHEEIRAWEILKHITISEDQTAASDIDRRRLLAALDTSSAGNPPALAIERSFGSDNIHDTDRQLELRHFTRSQPLRVRTKYTAMQPTIAPNVEPSGGLNPAVSNSGELDVNDQVPTDTRHPEPEPEPRNDHGVNERIEQLQREIALLQTRSTGTSTKPPKYEVFNILPGSQTTWLGEPTWTTKGSVVYFKGNLPVAQPDVHLERQGNIAFVVYRIFTQRSIDNAMEVAKTGRAALPDPTPTEYDIELRSQAMKDAAKSFFQELKKLNEHFPEPDLDKCLLSPFLFWYHYRFSGVLEQLSNDHQHLMSLCTDWIDKEYGKEYAEADDLFRQGLVTVPTMEYLLKPGEIVISTTRSSKERSRAYMVTSWPAEVFTRREEREYIDLENLSEFGNLTDFGMHEWSIDGWAYSYDGHFWKEKRALNVSIKTRKREEKVNINSLKLYPARFDDKLKLQLEQRGKTFWSCRHRRFVSYPSKGENDILVSHGERYMVDFPTYRKLHSDSIGFKQIYNNAQAHDYMPEDIMEKDEPPSPFVALFPPTIAGFNLRQKKWLDLEVDKIQDLQWNKDAFDRLVIDDETKELIQALITNRIVTEMNTDWISAKGNGLIMLLHGGPGTGKTFTAESVAELAEKPLYPVTCGDIGTRPEDVEKYLESVLTLGRLWDCVVLLDEADVFLEQRTLNDLKRNALVSVFLRVLEYYEGILILTSNRVGIFDEAFKSRIQLALHYENLQKPQRVKIWKNFLSRLQSLGEEDIDYDTIDSYIDELSDYDMNGRQIRNAITTARQLAKFKGKSMGFGHLRHVIKVAGKFDHYLLQVHDKISDDQIARGEGFR